MWMYADTMSPCATDVFFIAPTVVDGSAEAPLFDLQDSVSRYKLKGATNMEKGIYDANSRFFAPYYRQIGMYGYMQDAACRDSLLLIAYDDVKQSMLYYLEHWNQGRPIILAGFSQGADHCLRLLKDPELGRHLQQQLVACYAIGWYLTTDEVQACPWLHPATDETGTGAIVLISSEAPEIQGSHVIIPHETWTYSINPLSWTTDTIMADAELNHGACFTNYEGEITREENAFCGAYIDSRRGAIKVPGVSISDYPARLAGFQDGEFHIYDYQFFYRNLQENVAKRIANFGK